MVTAALIGYVAARAGFNSRFLAFPYYFALVNLAAFHALALFLKRQRHRVWQPRIG
jgi:hypothetical protein